MIFLLVVGCKLRDNSELKVKAGLADFLKLEKLEPKDRVPYCTRDILIFYVGNAEGLGELHLRGNSEVRKRFGEDFIRKWTLLERKREHSYHQKIIDEAYKLATVTGKSDRGCSDPAVAKLLKPGQSMGSVRVVAMIDGPNHTVSKNVKYDSQILSWTHRYIKNGDNWVWTPMLAKKPRRWIFDGAQVDVNKGNRPFELLVPRDVDPIMAWANKGGPDQTFYFFKSHGGVISHGESELIGNPILETLFGNLVRYKKPSVFLFDARGRKASASQYFNAVWSPKTYCDVKEQITRDSSKKCLARINNTLSKNLAEFSQDKPEKQGRGRKGSQGAGKRRESQGLMQGITSLTDDQIVLGGFWNNTVQGPSQPTILGGYKADIKDTIHFKQKTLPIFSKEALRDYWGPLRVPLTKEMLKKDMRSFAQLHGMPEAYRLFGDAKTLFTKVNFATDRIANPLRVIRGGLAPSLVLFDTCSSNVQDFLGWYKQTLYTNQSKDRDDVLVLSNPKPLLADAIDYGVLNGFQFSLFHERIDESFTQKKKSSDFRNGILDALTGTIDISGDDRQESLRRLFVSKVSCQKNKLADYCTHKTLYWNEFEAKDRLRRISELIDIYKDFAKSESFRFEFDLFYAGINFSLIESFSGVKDSLLLNLYLRNFIDEFGVSKILMHRALRGRSEVFRRFSSSLLKSLKFAETYFKTHKFYRTEDLPKFGYLKLSKMLTVMHLGDFLYYQRLSDAQRQRIKNKFPLKIVNPDDVCCDGFFYDAYSTVENFVDDFSSMENFKSPDPIVKDLPPQKLVEIAVEVRDSLKPLVEKKLPREKAKFVREINRFYLEFKKWAEK